MVEPRWTGGLAGRAAEGRPPEVGEDEEITDLKVLVDAIREAERGMRIPPQHSPWLPPLPDDLLLRDVPPVAAGRTAAGDLPPPVGHRRPARRCRRGARPRWTSPRSAT